MVLQESTSRASESFPICWKSHPPAAALQVATARRELEVTGGAAGAQTQGKQGESLGDPVGHRRRAALPQRHLEGPVSLLY